MSLMKPGRSQIMSHLNSGHPIDEKLIYHNTYFSKEREKQSMHENATVHQYLFIFYQAKPHLVV